MQSASFRSSRECPGTWPHTGLCKRFRPCLKESNCIIIRIESHLILNSPISASWYLGAMHFLWQALVILLYRSLIISISRSCIICTLACSLSLSCAIAISLEDLAGLINRRQNTHEFDNSKNDVSPTLNLNLSNSPFAVMLLGAPLARVSNRRGSTLANGRAMRMLGQRKSMSPSHRGCLADSW